MCVGFGRVLGFSAQPTSYELADTDAGIGLNRAKDVDDLFNQLEI